MVLIIGQEDIIIVHVVSLLYVPGLDALGLSQVPLQLSDLVANRVDGVEFLVQDGVEGVEVVVDVAADLVGLAHQEHLLLDQLDGGVDVVLVGLHELLLLLDYELDVVFVLLGELLECLMGLLLLDESERGFTAIIVTIIIVSISISISISIRVGIVIVSISISISISIRVGIVIVSIRVGVVIVIILSMIVAIIVILSIVVIRVMIILGAAIMVVSRDGHRCPMVVFTAAVLPIPICKQ